MGLSSQINSHACLSHGYCGLDDQVNHYLYFSFFSLINIDQRVALGKEKEKQRKRFTSFAFFFFFFGVSFCYWARGGAIVVNLSFVHVFAFSSLRQTRGSKTLQSRYSEKDYKIACGFRKRFKLDLESRFQIINAFRTTRSEQSQQHGVLQWRHHAI